MGEPIRLQKVLAYAGCGSRRACEEYITEGRVTVDGVVVQQLGSKADPETQSIALDGQKVAGPGKLAKTYRAAAEKVYYMLNKPRGVLSTSEDPSGRPLAVQLIHDKRRIYCVGRLDLETEGLLVLTNDGELANQLTHPRFAIEKVYIARVDGRVSADQVRRLEQGVHLAEGRTQGMGVRVRKRMDQSSTLELTISEGMNRQVRRMLAAVGLNCRQLRRVAIGPLKLGDLPVGESRLLTHTELAQLREAIGEQPDARRAQSAEPKKRPANEWDREEEEPAPVAAAETDDLLDEDTEEEALAETALVEGAEKDESVAATDKEVEAEPETAAVPTEKELPGDEALTEETEDEDEQDEEEADEEEDDAAEDEDEDEDEDEEEEEEEEDDDEEEDEEETEEESETEAEAKLETGKAPVEASKTRDRGAPAEFAPELAEDAPPTAKPKRKAQARGEQGERPSRPWKKREGSGPRGDKPWQKREGGARGDRPSRPWEKREGSAPRGDKPWQKREGGARGDRPSRPWEKREGSGPRGDKPWQKREGSARGDRPSRPWEKREGSAPRGDKPWQKREGGARPRRPGKVERPPETPDAP